MAYNPTADTYLWFKTIEETTTDRDLHVYFTQDGNRVLLFYYYKVASGNYPAVLFLDASSGALLGTSGFKKDIANGIIYGRDYLTMNSDGSKVFFIHQRNGWESATIHGYNFDGASWS